jgi:hypothetical protein
VNDALLPRPKAGSSAESEIVDRAGQPDSGIVDKRIRALIDEYTRLTGANLEPLGHNLLRFTVPRSDAEAFGGRQAHLLALDLDAVERYADSELPVVGSAFWSNLVGAIRRHGQRRVRGTLPITVTGEATVPDVSVEGASIALLGRRREARRIVRMTAKVAIAAGTAIHEKVIQGDGVDLTTGHELPASVIALFDAPGDDAMQESSAASTTAPDRIAQTLIAGLERKVAAEIDAIQHQADRDLKAELQRIDRYYETLKDEVATETAPGSAAHRAVEHEYAKRRAEEIRRYDVRVEVQPIQVLERVVMAERATWLMSTPAQRTAELGAHRYLSGDGAWEIRCPTCGQSPEALTVCRAGHAAGTECTAQCTVCDERFCTRHGHAACVVDGAPVCSEHAAECWSCEQIHCTEHQTFCADGGHITCLDCIVRCGLCERPVCRKHRTTTHVESPRGPRVLCYQCIVPCEGSPSELVGRDEAVRCGTCDRYICERHQVACVVDGSPHCSKHLRRADRSRRFICENHVARCDHEAKEVVHAADEVRACVECARASCDHHGAPCHGDQRWHCREHLETIADVSGAFACAQHRTVCHIDGKAFSLTGTTPCVVCAKPSCGKHIVRCEWCGGRACTNDMRSGRCVTCMSLKEADDLPNDVIAALAGMSGDARPKRRLVARDGTRFVVQLELGWTRKLVVSMPYGAARPNRVVRHSFLGSEEI